MKTIALQIVITLIAIEAVFRLFGYQPYSVQKYSLISEPNAYMLPDDSLGFTLNAGSFQVTINDSVKYIATHNESGQRITSYTHFSIKKPKIILFGGSFPYGMGTDDLLSYPFLLQKNIPKTTIENQCVPGFGMVQSLLQLDNILKSKGPKPQTVILHYASFYNDRNALTPSYRVALHHGFMNSNSTARKQYAKANYPFVKLKNENYQINFQPLDKIYSNWWGREYLATINYIQTLADNSSATYSQSNDISKWLIQELANRCKANNIQFIIATITNDDATDTIKTYCEKQKINCVDLFVDVSRPEYSNLPFDSHPNAKAHRIYSEKMLHFSSFLYENF